VRIARVTPLFELPSSPLLASVTRDKHDDQFHQRPLTLTVAQLILGIPRRQTPRTPEKQEEIARNRDGRSARHIECRSLSEFGANISGEERRGGVAAIINGPIVCPTSLGSEALARLAPSKNLTCYFGKDGLVARKSLRYVTRTNA